MRKSTKVKKVEKDEFNILDNAYLKTFRVLDKDLLN